MGYDEVDRALRPGAGSRGARRARHRVEDVLRLRDRVRRRAEHAGLPDVPGPARVAAGAQPHRRRVGDPHRSRAQLLHRVVVPVRTQELLLPGHAEELPDLAVRRADLLRGLARRRGRDRRGPAHVPRRDRARAHGGGHRQVAARRWRHRPHPGCRLLAGRLQPRRHPADRDRHQAHRPVPAATRPRSPAPTSPRCASCCARSTSPTSRWSRARCAATRTCRCADSPDVAAGHPHRDQERQLAALGRARGALRDAAAGGGPARPAGRSSRRRGTGTRTPASPRPAGRSPTPTTTATSPSPTSCRWPRPPSGSTSCAPRCPSRRPSGASGWPPSGGSATSRCSRCINAGAVELVHRDDRRRCRRRLLLASGGWASSPAAPTTRASISRPLGDHARPGGAGRRRWSTSGRLNDKLARQVIDGVLAGEGDPEAVADARGLQIVSDDGAAARGGSSGDRGRSRRRRRRSATARCRRSVRSWVR